MDAGTIFNVLTNPAYIGLATYNRREPSEPKRPRHPGVYRRQVKSSSRWRPRAEWLSVPIPAIIEPEAQNAVRAAVAKHKVWSPRNVQYEYLLRGLVVCGDCGWRMECAHQARRTQRFEYFYYACRHHDPVETGRPERCTARRVRQAALDAVVWDALARLSPDRKGTRARSAGVGVEDGSVGMFTCHSPRWRCLPDTVCP